MKRALLSMGLLFAFAAWAQGAGEVGKVKDGKVVKSARDEIARLQRQVDEQRALLVRILELQQQQYGMLVKLAKGELQLSEAAAVAPKASERFDKAERVDTSVPAGEPAAATPAGASAQTAASKQAAPVAKATGKGGAAVTGHVSLKGGNGPAWVFIEDLKATGTGALEVKQEDKQFSPRIAAVQRGTKLTFPNNDNIFHNVFSVSPGNSFDLGNTRSGETPRTYVANTPGVIDIFCNIHSKMSASVLVAPGTALVKVQPDGSYRLDDVPPGMHKVGAWAGGPRIVYKEIDVTASGAEVSFELQATEQGSHKNKAGQSYGSYAD